MVGPFSAVFVVVRVKMAGKAGTVFRCQLDDNDRAPSAKSLPGCSIVRSANP
jgi:hypothetical protein